MEVKKFDAAEITYEQFIEEHWKPGIPLVLKNATKVWGAYGQFSPDWFRQRFGERMTNVNGKDYTVTELMDLVEGKDTTRPVPYPCKYHIPSQLPELMPTLPHCTSAMPSRIGWIADGSSVDIGAVHWNSSSVARGASSPTFIWIITT